MGYSSKAIVILGYKIKFSDFTRQVTVCKKRSKTCPLLKSRTPFCSACGLSRDALSHTENPTWMIEELDSMMVSKKVGVYRSRPNDGEGYIGMIVGVSASEHEFYEIQELSGYRKTLADWIKTNNIKISGEPKLHVHLYESY